MARIGSRPTGPARHLTRELRQHMTLGLDRCDRAFSEALLDLIGYVPPQVKRGRNGVWDGGDGEDSHIQYHRETLVSTCA
jgi:hypothetical protein